MGKTLYTLNIDDYAPEIRALTYPLLEHYAEKIGAEFFEITERKFPAWPVVYEKLQIYELGEERGDDWSIFLDADTLVHPETFDWAVYIPKDTVAHNGIDFANLRWRYDRYFLRDGRDLGSCNWNTWASAWCRDLWRPLDDLTFDQAVANIFPAVGELNTVITPSHLIDDYTLSRNIARFGLKTTTLMEIQKRLGFEAAGFFWHQYTISVEEKVKEMAWMLSAWNWNLPSKFVPNLEPLVARYADEFKKRVK